MVHIDLNNEWKYSSCFSDEMLLMSYDESSMEAVRLPHTNKETPFHYFDEKIYQFVSCYKKHLEVQENWKGKSVLLTFEGVGHVAKVYLNGELLSTHMGGYTAFTVDLSKHLVYEQKEEKAPLNILTVEVDSRENLNIPPFGNVIDYMTYGGIYREVYLEVRDRIYLEDVFIITREDQLAIQITLNKEPEMTPLELKYNITGCNENDSTDIKNKITLLDKITHLSIPAKELEKWTLENPKLYNLHLDLTHESENIYDTKTIRFGFRTCCFKEDGFYLNGKKVKLRGLNRHQSFPYVGYAMPERIQKRDAEILKWELQVNAVRTSHYPQSKHFINRCDELGILVFTEIPGWQHIGDEKWKQSACENVHEMVTQYRNHPSIILWGVRINESPDDDEFYQMTNEIAHKLDPSRQTGGVRFFKKSHLLEDVYTYNDFLHNGSNPGLDKKAKVTSNQEAPYLVSEYNGHMFPTKSFDNESHRLEHALRHARVLDAIFEQSDIAGGFGWCMFDYNTHKDFGSGDKICYHGVMDMFRNPKLAAFVYGSQGDNQPFFEVSSTFDIGEYPSGIMGDIYVFTNADSINLYKNNQFIKSYLPKSTQYPHLPHPPIQINDLIGELLVEHEGFRHQSSEKMKEVLYGIQKYGIDQLPIKYKYKMVTLMLKEHLTLQKGTELYQKYVGNWGNEASSIRLEAIKNGQVFRVIEKKSVDKPCLKVEVGTHELHEKATYDVSDIRITAVDENGNRIPYYQEPVKLETWGVVELIGPDIISLKGGGAGTYVKTLGLTGDGGLRISQNDLGVLEIGFQVI